jgi:ribosomal-protein-alanine N-acetyltransferase
MSAELSTERLRLVALTMTQLGYCLNNIPGLEKEMGIPISRGIVDANVPRAINMKLGKMAEAEEGIHDWLTYWMIMIKKEPLGIGLIGFKGYPNGSGTSEIGYGIAQDYWNQGYMTESVKALSGWAFLNPECGTLTATAVANPASNRVLEKAGWKMVDEKDNSTSWELNRYF